MDQVIHDVAILNLPVVFGIDRGGLDVKAALFWAFVAIPLAWGVWKTLDSASKIF